MAAKTPPKPTKTAGKGKGAAKKAPARRVQGKAKVKVAPAKKAAGKPRIAASKEDLFTLEYLKDLNGAQAAIRAGYSASCARQTAHELLNKPAVQAKVQKAMDERAKRTEITADDVLKRLHAIATADPRELIELHRCCCRYCWGKDNYFQWTAKELREAEAQYEIAIASAKKEEAKLIRKPDPRGGIGYDPRKDPNQRCPECFGRGEVQVQPRDTRDVSLGASLLYAGVKTTQHGLEIKMHDQMAALRDIGRHLGMFKEKVEHSGSVGVHKTVADVLDDIDGAGTGLPNHANRGR